MEKKLPAQIAKALPKATIGTFDRFVKKGYEIYLVGAGVRRILQKKTPVDCDFTTNATPEQIQALFGETFYDNHFGTVGIPVETESGKEVYEITTYRKEWGYSDNRRPDGVEWGKVLDEDLKRRDFTINAIVIGPMAKKRKWDQKSLKLIDLFDGESDFSNRIIRAVGNPNDRFAEDALRMMRAIRLASQLGFSIDEKTFRAIKKNTKLINKVSWERIRTELMKMLSGEYPADGYQLLRNAGLSKIILPEVEECFGVEQKSPGRHHIFDVGTHSLMSLKYCRSKDPIVRLATLIHDVGKPSTFKKIKHGTITFYNHEVVGAGLAKKIAERLRLSKRDSERLQKLVRWHQFSVDERQTDSAIRRLIRNVGKENINDILAVRVADRLGGGARETSWRLERYKEKLIEVQKQPFSVADLKVDGKDVMRILKIKPGPEVGKVLGSLFKEVETDKKKNNRNYLLKQISTLFSH